MPSPQTIIAQLILASNSATAVAIAWHVAILVVVAALLLGWRPSNRAAALMLTAPVGSAAVVAFALGNPFNGSILGALAVALFVLGLRFPPGSIAPGRTAMAVAGVLLAGFGAFYPHFLENGSSIVYLYAAPTGVIPCPTLSLVIGFALLAGGLGSRAWSLTVAAVGLFYGLFGVLRLGVRLDVPLIAGAAMLTLAALEAGAP